METVDHLNPEISRPLAGKESRRQRLARVSFVEKIKAVVHLQKMAAPILRARGRPVHVWRIQNLSP